MDDKAKAKLYKQNKRICAIMVLGQGSYHGLSVIQKTKTTDYPHRMAWKIVAAMKKKNKPKDAIAKIEMDGELEKISFGTAQDYYNQVVAVIARYDVVKTDTELIKLMAKKVSNTVFSKLIIESLNQASGQYFEAVCDKINEIQRLTKATGGNKQAQGKETASTNTDGKFLGICGNYQKRCGNKRKDFPHPKSGGGGGTNTGSGSGIGKPCNNCGMKGHNEDKC